MIFLTRIETVLTAAVALLLPTVVLAGINSRSSLPTDVSDVIGSAPDPTTGSCLGGAPFTLYMERGCTATNLAEVLFYNLPEDCPHDGETELSLLLGGTPDPTTDPWLVASANLRKICEQAQDDYRDATEYPWRSITANAGIEGGSDVRDAWDDQYYDGNTIWNEEYQTELDKIDPDEPANVLREDTQYVEALYEGRAQEVPFEFPEWIDNFEDCDVNAIVCCWPSDRQANDNNGNCNTPYDVNCVDADPADNVDLCGADMSKTGTSSTNVNGGYAYYENDEEGDAHCHGMAWAFFEHDKDTRYRANNLFYISMYDHLHQRGYVRNTPGAPMCSCVDRAPIVGRADCTEIEANEGYTFTWDANLKNFTAEITYVDLNFNACNGAGRGNNNLDSFYRRLVAEGRADGRMYEIFKRTIVGNQNCDDAIEDIVEKKLGYELDVDPSVDGWIQVYGKGSMFAAYDPAILQGGTAFTKQDGQTTSPVFYVMRKCPSCDDTHKTIVYKRLTALPADGIDFEDLFLKNWSNEPGNVNHVDFKLHSSFDDATLDRNPWTYCNYDQEGVGFPLECGPTEKTTGQWNAPTSGQQDVAFYVWSNNPDIIANATIPLSPLVFGEADVGGCTAYDPVTRIKLEDGDFSTEEAKGRCVQMCASYEGHTGCETALDACFVHTGAVGEGTGTAGGAHCWVPCLGDADCVLADKCEIGSCDAMYGFCSYETLMCDDGHLCTIDTCDSDTGNCVHTDKVCDDSIFCTADSCNATTGDCVYEPIADCVNPYKGETGRVVFPSTIDDPDLPYEDVVKTIPLRNEYVKPVVVAYIPTRGGDQSIQVRMTNVTSTEFTIFLEEPDDEEHAEETATYIVMEEGRHVLDTGLIVEAGSILTSNVHVSPNAAAGDPIAFATPFESIKPAVLHGLNTYNNGEFLTTFVHDVTTDGFRIGLESAQTGNHPVPPGEVVSYVAFSQGNLTGQYAVEEGQDLTTSDGVTDSAHVFVYPFPFDEPPDIVISQNSVNGKDGGWARSEETWTDTESHVYSEEDQVGDTERGHVDESFAYAAFPPNTDLRIN